MFWMGIFVKFPIREILSRTEHFRQVITLPHCDLWGTHIYHPESGSHLLHALERSMQQSPVIGKYAGHAGHVRQTSGDVRQRAETLPDILSSRVRNIYNMQQGKQE